MQRLTWVSGSFPAHVLAARLRSEGIDCQLRGAIDSPYGLTVGAMARVDVYVPEDQMEDAQLVMLVGEVDATLAAPGEWAHAGEEARPRRWPMWTAIVLLLSATLGPLLVHWAR
jgi:putative signal transducing protein